MTGFDWKGLSDTSGALVSIGKRVLHLQSMSTNQNVAPLKFFFGGKHELDNGQTVWHYVHCSSEFGAVIREAGTVTLNVDVQPQLNGKDRVTAATLGGNVVFHSEYGLFDECRLYEFRKECKDHMMIAHKATKCTKLVFARGETVLRVNSVLKKGKTKQKTVVDRAWPVLRNHMIYEYFKRRPPLHSCMLHGAVTTASQHSVFTSHASWSGNDRLLMCIHVHRCVCAAERGALVTCTRRQ